MEAMKVVQRTCKACVDEVVLHVVLVAPTLMPRWLAHCDAVATLAIETAEAERINFR